MADSRIPTPLGFDPSAWASFVAEVNGIYNSLYEDPRVLHAEARRIAVEVLGPDFDEEPYERRQLDADLEARISQLAQDVGRFSRLKRLLGAERAVKAYTGERRSAFIIDLASRQVLTASGEPVVGGWALVERRLRHSSGQDLDQSEDEAAACGKHPHR